MSVMEKVKAVNSTQKVHKLMFRLILGAFIASWLPFFVSQFMIFVYITLIIYIVFIDFVINIF